MRMQTVFNKVAGLSVIANVVEGCYYRSLVNAGEEGSEGLSCGRSSVVSGIGGDRNECPEHAGKENRNKTERYAASAMDIFSLLEVLPIPKVWQKLHAGYHDESWKSGSTECAEDK